MIHPNVFVLNCINVLVDCTASVVAERTNATYTIMAVFVGEVVSVDNDHDAFSVAVSHNYDGCLLSVSLVIIILINAKLFVSLSIKLYSKLLHC